MGLAFFLQFFCISCFGLFAIALAVSLLTESPDHFKVARKNFRRINKIRSFEEIKDIRFRIATDIDWAICLSDEEIDSGYYFGQDPEPIKDSDFVIVFPKPSARQVKAYCERFNSQFSVVLVTRYI